QNKSARRRFRSYFEHDSAYAGRHDLKQILSSEGGAAATGLLRVGVDKVEALAHQRLFVVQHHAVQVDEGLRIAKDAAVRSVWVGRVPLPGLGIEENAV